MVNINRSGHAEWHFQTTSCKVCFLISVSAPTPIGTQHDHSWQKHISPGLLRWKLTFQVKAHQSLYTTHWHIENCCCYLCLLITMMHPDLSLQALHAWVHPTCMMTLGWWWLIPDHWFITNVHPSPPVISIGYQQAHTQHTKPNVHHLILHACARNPLQEDTNHQEKYQILS